MIKINLSVDLINNDKFKSLIEMTGSPESAVAYILLFNEKAKSSSIGGVDFEMIRGSGMACLVYNDIAVKMENHDELYTINREVIPSISMCFSYLER